MACACVARLSGRCVRWHGLLDARNDLAQGPNAPTPSYRPADSKSRALSQTSPRKACWASRSSLLGQAVSIEPFNGCDNAACRAAPLQQETAVGHLVGEGVLEVFRARGRGWLHRGFSGLQVAETRRSSSSTAPDSLQKGEGHLGAITAAVWRRCFSSGGRRSMRAPGPPAPWPVPAYSQGASPGDRCRDYDQHPGFRRARTLSPENSRALSCAPINPFCSWGEASGPGGTGMHGR